MAGSEISQVEAGNKVQRGLQTRSVLCSNSERLLVPALRILGLCSNSVGENAMCLEEIVSHIYCFWESESNQNYWNQQYML